MITIFSQIGAAMDNVLNWFINLNPLWQLIIFVVIALIFFGIFFSRRNN